MGGQMAQCIVAEEGFSRSVELHISTPSRAHLDKNVLNNGPWMADSNRPIDIEHSHSSLYAFVEWAE